MKKWLIAGIAIACVGSVLVPFAVVMVIVSLLGGSQQQVSAGNATLCTADWQGEGVTERDLNQVQLDAAATIYAQAQAAGVGDQGAVVGIATALQESDLGAAPSSLKPNADGDIGLFQQRTYVGWYADGATQQENITILLDHAYQAKTFFLGHDSLDGFHIPGLVDVENWQSLTLTQAAQRVQVSAYPDAYAKHEPLARALTGRLSSNSPQGQILCSGAVGGTLDCPPTGLSAEAGLNPDALRGLRCIKQNWPKIKVIGGSRNDPGSDHHVGNAIDPMIPDYTSTPGIALGGEIAEWAKRNAAGLGVTYVIWRKQIWSTARAGEGWRQCGSSKASCYSGSDPSAAHLDHVHISFIGAGGTGTPADASAAAGVSTGGAALPIVKGNYRLTARYNQAGDMWASGFHTGLDFAAPTGTPIVSISPGTVVEMTSHGAYGNLTKIKASDGTVLYYAHQSTRSVNVGQAVTAGQPIGTVGSTGNSSGAHLHLEVRVGGSRVDPEAWLIRHGVTP